jgi:hypothetical protein
VAIAYNACDALRKDPVFKMAVDRLPESGGYLCSQPTMTRLEKLRGPAAMITLFCDSFPRAPRWLVLDIDGTEDHPYGGEHLLLFNAHHDSPLFHADPHLQGNHGQSGDGVRPASIKVALVLRHVVRARR